MNDILMFVHNASTFKVYQELKQYFLIKNYLDNINLNYCHLPLLNDPCYVDKAGYIHSRLGYNNANKLYKYFFNSYNDEAYPFIGTTTINYLLQMIDNYINKRDISYNLIYQSNIESETLFDAKTKEKITFSEFEKSLNRIPKADVYLLTIQNEPIHLFQYILVIYLLKTYPKCHVFIGGGRNVNIYTPENVLLNKIGQSYFGNRLHRCGGDIGPTVFNFLNNKDYNNCYMNIEEYFEKPWIINLSKHEVETICDNTIYLSTSYGCPNKCAYCSYCCAHPYTMINSLEYYNDILKYLNNTYPNCKIILFDNELNDNLEKFKTFLKWIITNNIKNPFLFYINLYPLDEEALSLLYKINIGRITTSLDGMFENLPYRKNNVMNSMTIFNKLKALALNKNAIFNITSILFVPGSPNLEKYKTDDSFIKDIALKHLLHFGNATVEIYPHELQMNSLMYLNTDYYGIKTINYDNVKFKHFTEIATELEQLPLFYTVDNFSRYDRAVTLYKIFSYWYKYENILQKVQAYEKSEFADILYYAIDDIQNIYGNDNVYMFINNIIKRFFKVSN